MADPPVYGKSYIYIYKHNFYKSCFVYFFFIHKYYEQFTDKILILFLKSVNVKSNACLVLALNSYDL